MLSPEERLRYHRHLILPGFGQEAQERLKQARVLVVGAGGLGCPALLYLAAAGVGTLVVIDSDQVDVSNLQRQVLYSDGDVGKAKAEIAAQRLHGLNPHVTVQGIVARFRRDNALDLVRACDVVVDASDNFATRYLVNDACVMADRPFVFGAIQGFAGQLAVFNWRGGPTYRCLFPVAPPPELAPSCADAGVLGVLPGVIGTWQATEAIKLLTGVGQPLSGKLLLWDALTMQVQRLTVHPDPKSRAISELPPDDDASCASSAPEIEIDCEELRRRMGASGVQLIDVREAWERAQDLIEPSLHLPLPLLERGARAALANLDRRELTVVYCAAGVRSLRAAELLRSQAGFLRVMSLRGGMHAWRARG